MRQQNRPAGPLKLQIGLPLASPTIEEGLAPGGGEPGCETIAWDSSKDHIMELRSSAYRPGGAIPPRYTCDSENRSPEFEWSEVASQAKSLALVLHDPDAPRDGGFTHWVMYGIDPSTNRIDEDAPTQDQITDFGVQGKNDSGKLGYTGPCPASGTHHYIARLYALDADPELGPGATRQELESAMHGHIIDQAALTGIYVRTGDRRPRNQE